MSGRDPDWRTARAIAGSIEAMRRGILRDAPDGFDHLLEPGRVIWRGQIAQDEDFLVQHARAEGLALGPVRPSPGGAKTS